MSTGAVNLRTIETPEKSPKLTCSSTLNGDRERLDRVLMTKVGLNIPRNLSFSDWELAGRQMCGLLDSSAWCLGDWLVYGKKNFADRYARAIRAAGLQYQTLRNYAWVSRRFEMTRRRPQLSFQHHAEVASVPIDEQDWWLDQAEREMWTTKQLRTCMRDGRADGAGGREQGVMIPRIAVPSSRLVRWRKAADQTGVEFVNWMLSTLDRAAKETLNEELGVEF